MTDLPEERIHPSPPFSYVGVDTFGPLLVYFRTIRALSHMLKNVDQSGQTPVIKIYRPDKCSDPERGIPDK